MPLDDSTMVVHTWSNPLIYKHKTSCTQFVQDQTPLNALQLGKLAKEFDVDDLLAFAISHRYNLFFNHIVFLMFQPQCIKWYVDMVS